MSREGRQKSRTTMEIILALFLSFFIFETIWYGNRLQGTARIVNYAGIVRGATQRTIKLEVTGTQSDGLIEKLDIILIELMQGGEINDLTKIEDVKYQNCVKKLMAYWENLKNEIYVVRELGYESTDIIPMSEEYFVLADETVSAAEEYSQFIAGRLQLFEYGMAIAVVALLAILLQTSLSALSLRKANKKLENKAYIDVQTGLFNKSRCEELISAPNLLNDKTGLIMYDMNNLKKVNDSQGHMAGDFMIENFARILRLGIPEEDFVGRFGGDEFIVIMWDVTVDELEASKKRVSTLLEEFNQGNETTMQLSCAFGSAHSSKYEGVTMKTLLEKADYEMYSNKMNSKQSRG